jgi:hypothetical protein
MRVFALRDKRSLWAAVAAAPAVGGRWHFPAAVLQPCRPLDSDFVKAPGMLRNHLTPVDLHHPRNVWRKAPLPCQLEKNIVCFQLGQVTCSLRSVPSIRNNRTNTKIAVLPDSSDLHFLPPTRWKSKH